MSLLSLPNELLLEIARHLFTDTDISSLVRTNRRLCNLLDDYLYQFNVLHYNASALNWAAINGREETVPKVFAVHSDSDDLAARGYRAIELALSYENERVACKIIEHGTVDVNAHDGEYSGLLNQAVQADAEHFARLILSKGADPNLAFDYGPIPLKTAINRGCEGMVRLLIEYGSHVNSFPPTRCLSCENGLKRHRCRPPLHHAAEHGTPEVVQALLENGADPDMAGADGLRPIHVAALRGAYSPVLETLIAVGDVNCREDWCHRTALHLAVKRGYLHTVETLLQAEGIDVNARDNHDRTPLFLAAQDGHEAMVALLLEAPGIDIFVKNRWGQTPLSRSVMIHSMPEVETLIRNKAKELSRSVPKKRNWGRRRRHLRNKTNMY